MKIPDDKYYIRQVTVEGIVITTKVPKGSPHLVKQGEHLYTNIDKHGLVVLAFQDNPDAGSHEKLEIQFPNVDGYSLIDEWLISHGIGNYGEIGDMIRHEADYLLAFQED